MNMDDIIRQMQKRDEMMRRIADGPLGDARRLEGIIERASATSRAIELAQANSIATFMSRMATPQFALALEKTARQASEIMERLRAPDVTAAMERAAAAHQAITVTLERAAAAQEAMGPRLAAMALQIDATMKALPTIDFARLGSAIAVAEPQRVRLGLMTEQLVVRHTQFVEALAVPSSVLQTLPERLQQLPTQDLFVHTETIRSVTPHKPSEPKVEETGVAIRIEIATTTSVFLESTLPALYAPFLDQYRGARARGTDRGPDAWTQGGASLRKLLKGVLHRAAPNDVVLPWAQTKKMKLDRVGRPTRATKVAWLCEPVANDDYRAFVRSELDAALAIIDLLDASQHLDQFPEFQEKYGWILLRVEMAVRQILELWKLRN